MSKPQKVNVKVNKYIKGVLNLAREFFELSQNEEVKTNGDKKKETSKEK